MNQIHNTSNKKNAPRGGVNHFSFGHNVDYLFKINSNPLREISMGFFISRS
jgi:hypothetical protein